MMAYNRDMQNQLASYKEELSRFNKPVSVPVRVASVPVSLPVRGVSVPRFETVDSDEDEDITNIPEEDEDGNEDEDEQNEGDEEDDTGKQISILGSVKSKGKPASSSKGKRTLKPVKVALKL